MVFVTICKHPICVIVQTDAFVNIVYQDQVISRWYSIFVWEKKKKGRQLLDTLLLYFSSNKHCSYTFMSMSKWWSVFSFGLENMFMSKWFYRTILWKFITWIKNKFWWIELSFDLKNLLAIGGCNRFQCSNGGTCVESISGSSITTYCACKHGYTGKNCEIGQLLFVWMINMKKACFALNSVFSMSIKWSFCWFV